jgi:DNA modification methylase
MAGEAAEMVFTYPPYNVPIAGHVSGSGRHGEFAMAADEMSDGEFVNFLLTFLTLVAACGKDGVILFACMDWRHLLHLLTAGRRAGLSLFGLEIDPRYVDVVLRRFREVTGVEPVHAVTGLTLAELERGGRQLLFTAILRGRYPA